MEDSLTLEELAELHDITVERQQRFVKIMAAANGIDFEESDDVSSDKKRIPMSSDEVGSFGIIYGPEDIRNLNYGLGYEMAGER